MTEPNREGLALVAGALAFGVAADVLSRTVPARLDIALGVSALLLVAGILVQRGLLPAPVGIAPFGPPFALLTVALIWRDSPTLFALNFLGMVVLAAAASPAGRSVGYHRGLMQVARGATAGAAPLILREIDWRALSEGGPLSRVRAVLLGLAAAAPLATLFGGLLMDADPVFDRLMSATFAPRLEVLGAHALTLLGWFWVAAGTLRLFLPRSGERTVAQALSHGRFGLVEVGTVLAVLDLLFLAFVAVQFRYLFGGVELVRAATGLSYAEYARQGFFQLVAVASLSLPVLLFADRMLGRRDPAALRRFRLLASVMLVLLNVMLVSALWRMRLYTAEYGLTELRFYTTAFMGWLVLVLGWFAATVLRGGAHRFGAGAVTAGFLTLATLNLVNPDAVIARTNLGRAAAGRSVDFYYAAGSAPMLPRRFGGCSRRSGRATGVRWCAP
ncbi:MAG: DUF4173 domain-containing protein [Gemmatimonadales bacterium]|nr:DUF4173 domain-containing protein [Gemmatimonadales bacterium]